MGQAIEKGKKFLWVLGRKALAVILIGIILDFILGGFLFYLYVVFPKSQESGALDVKTQFNQDAYQSVLKILGKREQIFINPSLKDYPDPFQ